jgi:hypothetical protein
MSSSISPSQPAITLEFLENMINLMFPPNTNIPPQPTGYNVQVVSSGNTVDQTTNVQISGYGDEITDGNEVTTVTFLATFSNSNSYQFNQILFHTTSGGNIYLSVANFVLSSLVSKPSGYILVLSISFSISTPLQYINPIQDILTQCGSQCSNTNCSSVANGVSKYFMPFSVLNLAFIYLLGVTANYLSSLSDVQQYAQQYNNCMNNCQNICYSTSTENCALCINQCISSLSSNPIAVYVVANNISNLSALLPNGKIYVIPINICEGAGSASQVQISTIGKYQPSQNQIEFFPEFNVTGISSSDNALEILLYAYNNSYYALGVIQFQGTPSPAGTTFALYITFTQS